MTALHHRESLPPRPDGSDTVDTFLISDRAAELVDFLVAVLERATQHGAEIVTRPTDFFGDVFARFSDPAGNLWWIQRHDPGADTSAWTDDAATDESADRSDVASPELGYIHSTLTEAVHTLRDPRSRAV